MLPRRPTTVSAQLILLSLLGSAIVGSLTPAAPEGPTATPIEVPIDAPVDVEPLLPTP